MSEYINELMPDDGRNLPVAPFRFSSNERHMSYKKLCESALRDYYAGNAPLPLPEAVSLGILRANIQKRYDHQLSIVEDGFYAIHDETVMPGDSIRPHLDYFQSTKLSAIETGFRISLGQPLGPYNDKQAQLNALLYADMYGPSSMSVNPGHSLKVTRIIEPRGYKESFVVLKSKNRGVAVGEAKGSVESVGRRTGVLFVSALGSEALRAAKILARAGDSKHLSESHRNELKQSIDETIESNPGAYLPVLDRYYFTRADDDR